MMKLKNAVIASVFILACAGMAFCAIPPLDGLMTPPSIVSSTVTGKAVRALSGKLCVAASSATAGTCTTSIDGTLGINSTKQITASSASVLGIMRSSQTIIAGANTIDSDAYAPTSTYPLLVIQESNANTSTILGYDNTVNGPYLNFMKTRSASSSGDANTIVLANDYLGGFLWRGADGTSYRSAAAIRVQVDGTPGASDMPGRIGFETTPDGSITRVERMRISNSGFVTFASSVSIGEALAGTPAIAPALPLVITSTGGASGTIYRTAKLQTAAAGSDSSGACWGFASSTTDGYESQICGGRVSAGNNWISLRTGSNNPQHRLYVANDGNVAINNTSPTASLTVKSSHSFAGAAVFYGGSRLNDQGNSGQIIVGGDPIAGLVLTYDDSTGATYIDNQYNSTGADMYFRTKTRGTAVNALFIESAGFIGMGTTSPTGPLEVKSAAYSDMVYLDGASGPYMVWRRAGNTKFYNGDAASLLGGVQDAYAIRSPSGIYISTYGGTNYLLSANVNGVNFASSVTVQGDLGLKTYKETVVVTTVSAANYDVGWSSGSVYDIALASSTTLTFSGANDGQSMTFFVYQSSNSKTISWPTGTIWPGGATPALSTTTAKTDIFTFVKRGGRYFGFTGGQGY